MAMAFWVPFLTVVVIGTPSLDRFDPPWGANWKIYIDACDYFGGKTPPELMAPVYLFEVDIPPKQGLDAWTGINGDKPSCMEDLAELTNGKQENPGDS